MAAPATTARGTPAGKMLKDGYRTVIASSLLPTVSIWEKSVKPPGLDGGEAIPQTTMHNVAWRTFAARSLKDLTPITFKGSYDPNCVNQLMSLVNDDSGSWTVTFRDLSTLDFFGYLQKFEPDELVEGTQPEATVTIMPTNWDRTNGVEAAPVLTSVSGT